MSQVRGPPAALALLALLAATSCTEAFYDRDAFRAIVFNDNSNDDAVRMTPQELITRSGFNFSVHLSVADDGYVTQLIRLINPLVDRAQLRSPPVLLFHGASLDQTCYLFASSIQHFPERWPRSLATADGPRTSSNRSLAFMLANRGFDVWLIGQRGSNRGNQGFVPRDQVSEARANYDRPGGFELTAENYEFVERQREQYYLYGQDEVIAFELREQMDRVLALANATELTVFTFSLSTPTSLAFLAARPEYARRVRTYIQMAPSIAADHFTLFGRAFFEGADLAQPARGVGFLALLEGQRLLRESILTLSATPVTKYTVTHEIMMQLFGPSQLYHTNLELNVLGHIFQDVSHKTIQQYSQNSVARRFQKFDFGALENLRRYGQLRPPAYNTSRLEVQNYVMIDGSYDSLADQTTTQRVIETTRTPRPVVKITAPGFNHLDMIAAVENARYVNFPLLAQLEALSD